MCLIFDEIIVRKGTAKILTEPPTFANHTEAHECCVTCKTLWCGHDTKFFVKALLTDMECRRAHFLNFTCY